ncbi:MAG: hypothetical protein HYU66_04295 [Armatimonadetes bacterium]|nr:hypothetical protein [Armatimonadota bacterium]
MATVEPHQLRVVDGLLAAIEGELDAAENPHRRALRELGVNALGWTEHAYSDEAFAIWAELLDRIPDDLETLHHLAIMHHARAIDREASADPRSADSDWQAALGLWQRLATSDAFWQRIGDIACKGMTHRDGTPRRDAIDDLRGELPRLLLQTHFDLAFAEGTPNYRARFHIRLAHEAPFARPDLEAVRRRTYERMVALVPADVWQSNELDPERIRLGTEAVERYLELDPGCIAALADAARLGTRLVRAWLREWEALTDGDEAARTRLVRHFEEACHHWKPYFDQVVSWVEGTRAEGAGTEVEQQDLSEEMAQKLALWYRIMGEVQLSLDHYAEALELLGRGSRVASDAEDRERCDRMGGMARAQWALAKTQAEESGARAYCDEVWAQGGLTPAAHSPLANAYALLGEWDLAETVCRQGLELGPPDTTDWDRLQEHEREGESLRHMRDSIERERREAGVLKLLDQAREAMHADRHAEALAVLDQAAESAADVPVVFFLRSQCRLGLNDVAGARADCDRFRHLAAGEPQAMAALERLEADLAEQEGLLAKYGAEGLSLHQRAVAAYNDDRYADAIGFLRQALRTAPRQAHADLNHELAVSLATAASAGFDAAMNNSAATVAQRLASCTEAKAQLEEATRLDPGNANHRRNLTELTKIIGHLGQEAQVVGKFGERTLQFRRQAAEAFEGDRFDEALSLLQLALQACAAAGRDEVIDETVIVYRSAAAKAVNECREGFLLSADAKRDLLDAAIAYLEHAVQLRPVGDAQQELTFVRLMRVQAGNRF